MKLIKFPLDLLPLNARCLDKTGDFRFHFTDLSIRGGDLQSDSLDLALPIHYALV